MKEGRLLSLIIAISLVLILAITLPLAGGCAPKEKVYKIGYTQIVSHPALNTVHDAFVEVMANEGFVEGVNVEYDYSIPEGDMTVAKTIADQFVSEKCDLIAPITTVCTRSGFPSTYSIVT